MLQIDTVELMTKTQRPRKERKENADKRRRQLLDATYRSIAANGLGRTTLATVSNEAGLSQGVAIFYFHSKDGLFVEALRDLYQTYADHWQAMLSAAGDAPLDRLIAIIRADFDPKVCNAEVLSVWFAFWGEQSFTPQYADIAREFDVTRHAAIREACEGLLPDDHARAARVAEWVDTLTDGYWQNLHLYPAKHENDHAFEATMRFLRDLLPEYGEGLNRHNLHFLTP